jgi:stage IV sporulation protein FB
MTGAWSLGRIGGVAVRLHWSALLGAIFFSGFRFAPGAWLGFVAVILVHELGHALVVRVTGQHVFGVDVHGLGGECRWAGHATPLQRAAIAWGGVWAQLALFAVALPVSWVVGHHLGAFGADLLHALTWSSLSLAAINLLPIAPLDGAEAWKLPRLLAARLRERRAASRKPPPPAAPVPDDLRKLFASIAQDAGEARRSHRR